MGEFLRDSWGVGLGSLLSSRGLFLAAVGVAVVRVELDQTVGYILAADRHFGGGRGGGAPVLFRLENPYLKKEAIGFIYLTSGR